MNYRITKKEFYALGGFSNRNSWRIMGLNGKWEYYHKPETN